MPGTPFGAWRKCLCDGRNSGPGHRTTVSDPGHSRDPHSNLTSQVRLACSCGLVTLNAMRRGSSNTSGIPTMTARRTILLVPLRQSGAFKQRAPLHTFQMVRTCLYKSRSGFHSRDVSTLTMVVFCYDDSAAICNLSPAESVTALCVPQHRLTQREPRQSRWTFSKSQQSRHRYRRAVRGGSSNRRMNR